MYDIINNCNVREANKMLRGQSDHVKHVSNTYCMICVVKWLINFKRKTKNQDKWARVSHASSE